MLRRIVCLAVLGLVFLSLGGRSLVLNVAGGSQHVVKPGDTLTRIGQDRGVPVDEILAMNDLPNPNDLGVGQVLALPDPPPAPPARPPGEEYVVRAGDTLSGIARTLGTTRRAVAEANQLADPDRLSVGQRLAIPEGASGPAPARAASSSSRPSAAPTAPLADRVAAAARAVAGPSARVGVAGRNLVAGQALSIAAGESFPSASVAKLAILAEAYRQDASGRRPLTDAMKADLRRMITVSDNDAANRLMDVLGVANINAGTGALGLGATHLSVNRFGAPVRDPSVMNRTTPADMARFLELLAADQVVSQAASREMRYLLSLTVDGSKIGRGLPRGARLAHKSGWFSRVANDVGIVTHGRGSYVLAVFTEGIPDLETANQTIAAITRTVHQDWAGP